MGTESGRLRVKDASYLEQAQSWESEPGRRSLSKGSPLAWAAVWTGLIQKAWEEGRFYRWDELPGVCTLPWVGVCGAGGRGEPQRRPVG